MDFKTEFKPLTVQPQEIEGKSFEMITEELGEHPFTAEQYPVVQRVIHASADFELGRSMVFHRMPFKQELQHFAPANPSLLTYR